MSRRHSVRFLTVLTTTLSTLALVAPGAAPASAAPTAAPASAAPAAAPASAAPAASAAGLFPNSIALPNGFAPEGIAIGPGPVAYTGSLVDGDIYAADLRTGRGRVISQGPGTPSVGMKTDRRGRLFVAGGSAGNARVIDTRTGRVLASYVFAAAPTFVNDVVLSARFAWFTDSANAVLYGVPIAMDGTLGRQADVVRRPLTGEWVQTPGAFNANGIALTPHRRALLVVNSSTSQLYRVNRRSGNAKVVDLGGYALTNGDGLLVQGTTLYVVQNRLNKVAEFRLNHVGTQGRLVRTLTSPAFDVPTTVAAYGRRLYLPNARFGTPPTATTTYSINAVWRG